MSCFLECCAFTTGAVSWASGDVGASPPLPPLHCMCSILTLWSIPIQNNCISVSSPHCMCSILTPLVNKPIQNNCQTYSSKVLIQSSPPHCMCGILTPVADIKRPIGAACQTYIHTNISKPILLLTAYVQHILTLANLLERGFIHRKYLSDKLIQASPPPRYLCSAHFGFFIVQNPRYRV